MKQLGLVVTVGALLAGCGDDGSTASSGDSPTSTSAGDGSGTAAPATTSDDDPTAAPTSGTTTSPPDTSSTTASDTTGSEAEWCNGWDETAARPFLQLYADSQQQTQLADGATWDITCGGQGSWMFPLYPALGGFVPAGGMVTFAVEIDVEGFPGPTGPFYAGPMYLYDVECFSGADDSIGGFSHDCIAVLPPDDLLADLSVLDGAIASVHVDLMDSGGTTVATVDLVDLVLSAPMRQVSQECFF